MSQYLLFTTKLGQVKKTKIDEYSSIRPSGLVAINLFEDDQLLSTHLTSGKDEVLMVTAGGKAIRFSEKDVRPTGRATKGVKGISLKRDDHVIGADVIAATPAPTSSLLTITENGYGKITDLAEYNTQGRGGQGVFTHKVGEKTGKVVDMKIVGAASAPKKTSKVKPKTPARPAGGSEVEGISAADLLVVSTNGQTIRLPLSDVPSLGRHTQGVRIIKLNHGDKVAALATL